MHTSLSQFYYKIMKILYMDTIIGSSGRDCGTLIILFQLYRSKTSFFEGIFFVGGSVEASPKFHTGRKTNPVLV